MLTLSSVSKRFGETVAVDDLSLEVREGELLTLLGPSGCGKTTTLRMIAGFERPSAGTIALRGRDITRATPQARGFGMVFQNYALFPHLSVRENVAFGLKVRRMPRAEVARRTAEALDLVDLDGYADRRVQQLSGGQQQRVALARALAPEPPLLLLDEPLSNLDAALRERTRGELRALLERLGMTAVFVTHDQEEAFALSDRIAVLREGRLQQAGSPEALYARPANPFVAAFLGRANFLAARVVSADGARVGCELEEGVRWEAELPADTTAAEGDAVRVMIRPERTRMTPLGGADGDVTGSPRAGGGARPSLVGEVTGRVFAGDRTHYSIRLPGGVVTALGAADDVAPGDRVLVDPDPEAVILAFPTSADEGTTAGNAGDAARMADGSAATADGGAGR